MMLRALAIGVLAGAVMAGAGSGQDARLKRLTLRDDLLGWEAVGRVDIGGQDGAGGFCTGTLIATDIVLTAAHCVFDPSQGFRRADPAVMRFRAGLRDDTSIAERKVVATVVSESYVAGPVADADSIRHDIALLKLESPIPAAAAAPFEVAAMPAQDREVAVVSYAVDRATALSIERNCAVLGHDTGLFAFNCNVSFGSSGAPVFDMRGGRGKIISIVSAGHQDASGTISYGTELPQLVASLRRDLAAGRGVVTAAPRKQAAVGDSAAPGRGEKRIRAGGALFVKPPQP